MRTPRLLPQDAAAPTAPRIDMPGIPLIVRAALTALLLHASVQAQTLAPRMECGSVQANLHIRCTGIGVAPLVRERAALWTDVPALETVDERYIDESECHAVTAARCEQISSIASTYARLYAFEQTLGSRGCIQGASGNGWVEPYLAWRAKVVLPRLPDNGTWQLTVAANTVTAATIQSWPDPAVAIAPCQFSITGIATSKSVDIPRTGSLGEFRAVLRDLGPGEYLAQLRCPAIQGSECRTGKASVSMQLTASPGGFP